MRDFKKKKKNSPALAGEPAISSQFDDCGLITAYENTSFQFISPIHRPPDLSTISRADFTLFQPSAIIMPL